METTTRENQPLTDLDREIVRLANEGTVQEYLDALLRHPEKGRLLRLLAMEDSAPEHHEFMQSLTDATNGRPA